MTIEQSPLIARRAASHDPGAPKEHETVGYVFWGVMAILIAIPEILAAFGTNITPWPTISKTVGNLETHHHWVRMLVMGGLVVLAARIVFYPWPNRKPDPPAKPLPPRLRKALRWSKR